MNSLTKILFKIFSQQKSDQISATQIIPPAFQISRVELREFLTNNNLEGELLKSVTELRAIYSDLTDYQAVEYLFDTNEQKSY